MLKLANEENKADVYNYFETVRQNCIQMIQTPDRYSFVYNAIYESASCGNTATKSDNFHPVFTTTVTTKNNSGKLIIEEEFYKLLSSYCETAPDASVGGGKLIHVFVSKMCEQNFHY